MDSKHSQVYTFFSYFSENHLQLVIDVFLDKYGIKSNMTYDVTLIRLA